MTRSHTHASSWLALLLPLSGCNRYEMFLVSGHEQISFSNQVDVLFVTDNSGSIAQYSAAILQNFELFLADMAESGIGTTGQPTLTDAVNNYLTYSDRGRITDFQMAVTTTTVDIRDRFSDGADPGESGLIVGMSPWSAATTPTLRIDSNRIWAAGRVVGTAMTCRRTTPTPVCRATAPTQKMVLPPRNTSTVCATT